MRVHIGLRYTREHTLIRTPERYEEVNSPCESIAERRIQLALLCPSPATCTGDCNQGRTCTCVQDGRWTDPFRRFSLFWKALLLVWGIAVAALLADVLPYLMRGIP